MNALLPPILARALAPMAPASSVVHSIVAAADCKAIACKYRDFYEGVTQAERGALFEVADKVAARMAPLPRSSFNDDDWYVYDTATLEIVQHYGSKSRRPQAQLGQCCVSGMSAKYLGLWRSQC